MSDCCGPTESIPTPDSPLPGDLPRGLLPECLTTFEHLRKWLFWLAAGVVLLAIISGFSIYVALEDAASVKNERIVRDLEIQKQITQLACMAADEVPPGNQLTDDLRSKYHCGAYKLPKAKVEPKHPAPGR